MAGKMIRCFLVVCLCSIILFAGAFCAQVASGPFDIPFNQSLGMINIPTANILKNGEMRMSLNAGCFSLGLFDFFEVGLIAFQKDSDFYWGNRLAVKYIEENGIIPAIAVGGESCTKDPTNENAMYLNSVYMVASHNLGDLGTAHLGIGNGRFLGTGETSSKLDGVFMGIEKTFFEETPFPLTLKLEEDGKDVNFGMMVRILSGFHMVASICKLDNVMFAHPAPDNNVVYYFGFVIEGQLAPVKKDKYKAVKYE